jgi:hypothetical protein
MTGGGGGGRPRMRATGHPVACGGPRWRLCGSWCTARCCRIRAPHAPRAGGAGGQTAVGRAVGRAGSGAAATQPHPASGGRRRRLCGSRARTAAVNSAQHCTITRLIRATAPHHMPHTHTSPPPHRRAAAPRRTPPTPPAHHRRAHLLVRTQPVSATLGRRVRRDDREAGARDCVPIAPPQSCAGRTPPPRVWPARRLARAAHAGPPRVASGPLGLIVVTPARVPPRPGVGWRDGAPPPPPAPPPLPWLRRLRPWLHCRAHAVARPAAASRRGVPCVYAGQHGERERTTV